MGTLSFISHKYDAFLRVAWIYIAICVGMLHAQTPATTVPVLLPTNIAVDLQGNLYLSETGRHVVRRVDAQGQITTVAGSGIQGFDGDGGAASSALLDSPLGLAVDNKSLYIADSHNHRIRRVELATGKITTFAGGTSSGQTGDGGQAINARLQLPSAVALDTAGALYIADAGDHRVRKIAASGVISTVAGAGVQGFSGDGNASSSVLDSPAGIAVDSKGNIFLSDLHNHRVCRIDAVTGEIATIAGNGAAAFAGDGGAATSARLSLPRGISIDATGNIYIADSANHRLRRIDASSGRITTIAGDGTQAFAGDGGAPMVASLNSPSSVAIAETGFVDLADTGNARVRQITTASLIQTVVGPGSATSTALTISGAPVVLYGSGQLTAVLNSGSASGNVTFFDISSGSSLALDSVVVENGRAVLNLSTLETGQHRIMALYAGDKTHLGSQSVVTVLTVAPIALGLTLSQSTVEYGAAVPVLQGVISGVLDRDRGKVAVTLTTAATAVSTVGNYPVSASLSGASAANYTISTTSISIVPAQTSTSLTLNSSSVASGQPVSVTALVKSSTGPLPVGTISIVDNGVVIGGGSLDSSGKLSWASTALAAGTHSMTAVYSGDSNFRSSSSVPVALAIEGDSPPPQDFGMSSIGATTQTVVAGSSASFTLNVQPQAGLSSQVSLAATGAPNGATVSFNPGYVVPGSAANVTFTVATPKTARLEVSTGAAIFVATTLCFGLRRRRYIAGLALLPLILMGGCGDRVAKSSAGTASPKSYSITVTGTATGSGGTQIQHSLQYTLVVVPSN